MKFTTPLAVLALMATTTPSVLANPTARPDPAPEALAAPEAAPGAPNSFDPFTNILLKTRCEKREGGAAIMTAINRFCAKTDMVVPSPYANNGVTVNGWTVRIKGSCKPAQWVPSYWCTTQLHDVCGEYTEGGIGLAKYGKNGCQGFFVGPAGSDADIV